MVDRARWSFRHPTQQAAARNPRWAVPTDDLMQDISLAQRPDDLMGVLSARGGERSVPNRPAQRGAPMDLATLGPFYIRVASSRGAQFGLAVWEPCDVFNIYTDGAEDYLAWGDRLLCLSAGHYRCSVASIMQRRGRWPAPPILLHHTGALSLRGMPGWPLGYVLIEGNRRIAIAKVLAARGALRKEFASLDTEVLGARDRRVSLNPAPRYDRTMPCALARSRHSRRSSLRTSSCSVSE